MRDRNSQIPGIAVTENSEHAQGKH